MTAATIDARGFSAVFDRFQGLVATKSGHPFTTFHDGLAGAWESYKPRLRDHALSLLRAGEWSEHGIGSGAILSRAIEAIEIQDNRKNLINNLVFWQNRYGHANRDHRVLLEAETNPKLGREIERLLFGFYRGGADEGTIFNALSDLTGSKYPLLAYLFFLKDMDRFMPIQPTGFDRAFRTLGVDFSTLRQCNWGNYSAFNETLNRLRSPIAEAAGLKTVRLVDAHSFCWILASLLKQEAEGALGKVAADRDAGRILGGREKAIVAMRYSVEDTVRNARGQTVLRHMKVKELRMTPAELESYIASLLDLQDNRCALTGISLNFYDPEMNAHLLPSVDRIDSNGHYEAGNLQIVCRFINFWKNNGDNEEFKRLLMYVRGIETSE